MNRPTSVTVFGILNIVFGILGLFGALMSAVVLAIPGAREGNPVYQVVDENAIYGAWATAGMVLGAVATLVLLAAGGGLLSGKPWGRLLSVYYGVYAIVMTLVGLAFNAIFLFPALIGAMQNAQGVEAGAAVGGAIGGTVGSLAGLIYPVLLIYFMTRPHVVSYFGGDGPETSDTFDGMEAMPAVSVTSDNPYQSPTTSGRAPVPVAPDGQNEAIATIIPYRNGPALVAYYLGVFSVFACIPFVGIFGIIMAVAAVVCGVKGLRRASEDGEAKGRVHAWIGIIGGAVCGILGTVIQGLIIFGLIAAAAGA